MDKAEVQAVLEEIAELLELQGENPFKVRAYTNAARALNNLEEELAVLVAEGRLGEIRGFGKALVEKITALVETGRLEYLDRLREQVPESLRELLKLSGLGPKGLRQYHTELGVESLDDLERVCRDGSLAALPGSGDKTAANLLQAIERSRRFATLFLYSEARVAADALLVALEECPAVSRVAVCGSLRRYKELTKDVDLLAASDDPQTVMECFLEQPSVSAVTSHGETKSSVRLDTGIQADLRVVTDQLFAYALHHLTGSREHNVAIRSRAQERGLKVSEWGLFHVATGERIACRDEAALFRTMGLSWIPPELREDMGEIQAADDDDLPVLVAASDYRGVLHCHSQASDGHHSIAELADFAGDLGHEYLGITDHSRSSFQANGLSEDRLAAQLAELKSCRAALPTAFRLFAGLECDIKPDGALDFPDEVLAPLDYIIVAVHSAFGRSRDEMTKRVIRAIEHPLSRILAHPTGRLLRRRPAYDIDLHKVIDAAAANDVAIELNCHPMRLDMDWRHWRRARDRGVVCTVNPDAHSIDDFSFIELGIGFCRKGWLRDTDILNCWPAHEVERFFARR